MSALLTAHSVGDAQCTPPRCPTPVASPQGSSASGAIPPPSPSPQVTVAVKRERSPSADAATASIVSAPPVDEQPVEKKAPHGGKHPRVSLQLPPPSCPKDIVKEGPCQLAK
jgi:hypothetical protein